MLKEKLILRALVLLLCLSLVLGLVPGGIFGSKAALKAHAATLTASQITDVVDSYPRLYLSAQEVTTLRAHISNTGKSIYGFTWKS